MAFFDVLLLFEFNKKVYHEINLKWIGCIIETKIIEARDRNTMFGGENLPPELQPSFDLRKMISIRYTNKYPISLIHYLQVQYSTWILYVPVLWIQYLSSFPTPGSPNQAQDRRYLQLPFTEKAYLREATSNFQFSSKTPTFLSNFTAHGGFKTW